MLSLTVTEGPSLGSMWVYVIVHEFRIVPLRFEESAASYSDV